MSVQIENPDERVIDYNLIIMLVKENRVDEAAEMIFDHRLSFAMVKWNLEQMDATLNVGDFIAAAADHLISSYILGDNFMENNCEY